MPNMMSKKIILQLNSSSEAIFDKLKVFTFM